MLKRHKYPQYQISATVENSLWLQCIRPVIACMDEKGAMKKSEEERAEEEDREREIQSAKRTKQSEK